METVISLAILFASIILHEVAHGYVAYRLGDPTAREANRLTLNPLAHVDLFGTIILPALLVLFHSPVLLGWAKPVPFNPGYFANPKKGIMLVGAAGPVTNFVIAILAAAVFHFFGLASPVGPLLAYVCIINISLALFNLIPIPPLDGSRVILGLLPDNLIRPYLQLERFGFLVIFVLLYVGALDRVILPVSNFLFRLLLGGG